MNVHELIQRLDNRLAMLEEQAELHRIEITAMETHVNGLLDLVKKAGHHA